MATLRVWLLIIRPVLFLFFPFALGFDPTANHFSIFNIKKWLVPCHSRKSQERKHIYGQQKSPSKIKTNSIKRGFGLYQLGTLIESSYSQFKLISIFCLEGTLSATLVRKNDQQPKGMLHPPYALGRRNPLCEEECKNKLLLSLLTSSRHPCTVAFVPVATQT